MNEAALLEVAKLIFNAAGLIPDVIKTAEQALPLAKGIVDFLRSGDNPDPVAVTTLHKTIADLTADIEKDA